MRVIRSLEKWKFLSNLSLILFTYPYPIREREFSRGHNNAKLHATSDQISNPRVVVVHQEGIGGAVQTQSAHKVPNEKIFLDQYLLVIDTVLGIPLPTEMCMHSLGYHSA